ncbi:MAG: FMN-binding protein [Lachnospiraceae bacterium]|nr:FMN-binding protein [Lachnospiraceae bacterium]
MDKKQTSLAHDIIILTIITIVAGILLGIVHDVTAAPIAIQQQKALEEGQKAVFENAASFELADVSDDVLAQIVSDAGLTKTKISTVYLAQDASGETLGYVVDSTNSEGYGGDIQILTGITAADGAYTVNSITFMSISETAGMGMKAKDAEFKDQFNDLGATAVTVSGDAEATAIDAISGATITSKAVVKAVNAALSAAQYMEAQA